MALFQKKPLVGSSVPLYTLGLSKTILIVGLGNVGKDYDGTRHNIGFVCADRFVEQQDYSPWVEKRDLKCYLSSGMTTSVRVIVIKPTTMMNLSGAAVQAVTHFYKINPTDIFVVHDELDVDFGQIRMRTGGGAAGHNGIKSIIERTGEDFGRIRIGIGPKTPDQIDSADFVLAKFNEAEQEGINLLTKEVISVLGEAIASGKLTEETRSWLI